ncbi:unnamed protein product [Lactuca saligna]|uniref:Uncharacterized protein n=1 Tax=Lactuca saligna TaxID=75948 RepID=A0AA35YPS0_LACSI|nr:unnamed protein product [Lactuca saligna]
MLKRVDPTNPVLMEYLVLINPNEKIGVLLANIDEGSSKKSQRSKKDDKSTLEINVQDQTVTKSSKKQSKVVVTVSTTVTKLVDPEVVEPLTETIPSKSGVVIHEVQAPVSPSSKKRRAEDIAKHISKKIKKLKLVIQKVHSEEEEFPKTPEAILSMQNSTPKQTPVIPPEVSLTNHILRRGLEDLLVILNFDPEEEDIPDHMLMSGKQFKILSKKLNSILKSQADAGGRNFVSSIEVDVILKAQEARLFNKLSSMIQEFES